MTASKPVIVVGDRVLLTDGLKGEVKFVGEVAGKKGVFYGIEIDDGEGKNDGSVKGHSYFKCAAKKGLFVEAKKIKKNKASEENANLPRVTVGDKVKIPSKKASGVIKYMGYPDFKEGLWYGVELEKPVGKNDGEVKGKRYFTCKKNYGAMVQPSQIESARRGSTATKPAVTRKPSAKSKTTKPAAKGTGSKKTKEEEKETEFEVGQRVTIDKDMQGQIKFKGPAKQLGPGTWFGVRLTEKRGNCDGEYKGFRAFSCPESFGVFVQLKRIKGVIKDADFDFMKEDILAEKEAAQNEKYQAAKEELKKIRNKFKEIDTDQSGTIEFSEFQKLVQETNPKINAKELFDEIDTNSNETISFAEFDKWAKTKGIADLEAETETTEEETTQQKDDATNNETTENNESAAGATEANEANEEAAPATEATEADNADNADNNDNTNADAETTEPAAEEAQAPATEEPEAAAKDDDNDDNNEAAKDDDNNDNSNAAPATEEATEATEAAKTTEATEETENPKAEEAATTEANNEAEATEKPAEKTDTTETAAAAEKAE